MLPHLSIYLHIPNHSLAAAQVFPEWGGELEQMKTSGRWGVEGGSINFPLVLAPSLHSLWDRQVPGKAQVMGKEG